MTYQIADQKHTFMGLEKIGTHRYGNLERKD